MKLKLFLSLLMIVFLSFSMNAAVVDNEGPPDIEMSYVDQAPATVQIVAVVKISEDGETNLDFYQLENTSETTELLTAIAYHINRKYLKLDNIESRRICDSLNDKHTFKGTKILKTHANRKFVQTLAKTELKVPWRRDS